MSLAELSSKYGITKLTINGRIRDVKEFKVDENEVINALKKKWQELKKKMKY
ncbi:MAG: hypothetical protein ACLU6S_13170 [Clostridium sp.]